MILARCIKDNKHNKVGDIVEIGAANHPFIASGNYEIVIPKKITSKKVAKKLASKKSKKK